ncbi:hypothetical protein L6270_04400 [Candidatus Parcubacteria bacterium]|nr:hypothetical protein [Patescibacteria group bacterium]MBU4309203.1 hypothetical protein [Patescibacteria group bacterium]MBU4432633.1 hypothetical protein [Patescibacteria group bacterium]MBU4577564.1 hypothetical protein [Patescibacteria group bacterium]MCG2697251.1 hypothetical protein [Candidatus Parcubacteria bacterium]
MSLHDIFNMLLPVLFLLLTISRFKKRKWGQLAIICLIIAYQYGEPSQKNTSIQTNNIQQEIQQGMQQ